MAMATDRNTLSSSWASQSKSTTNDMSRIRAPSADDWEAIKSLLYQHWIIENRTLKDVQEILESEHGFRATARMYKIRIRQYGFDRRRRHPRKPATMFYIHGRRKSSADLRRCIKDKPMSEDDFLNSIEIGAETPHIRCCTSETTSGPTSAGSDDSATGISFPFEASPVRCTDFLDPFDNVSSFEHQKPGPVQEISSSNYDYDIKNKESMLNSNSLSGSRHLRRFESPKQGDDPEQEIVNASKRSVPAPEIKADGSSDHSPIRSLRPGPENVKCATFEIFANRSTIEILIDHYLKASGLTHLTKLNFSYLADQVLKRVPRSHVAHVIDQVITDHLQQPMCRKGRNDRSDGEVVRSDQAGVPPSPSAMCLNNELLDAGSDSGYASSFAASNRTRTGRLEESVPGSPYLLGRILPEFEDRSMCHTRNKWQEDQSGQLTSNDVDIDLRACSSGISSVSEASYSSSPFARHSPARSLDSRAVSEGEMSFAMSADSDDLLEDWEVNLDPELIRIRSHLVQQLVDSYTSTESEIHDAIQLSPSGEPSSSSQGSSNHSSSSRSRTTQTSKTSLGKHKMSHDEGDDDMQEEDRPSRRKRTRVTTESVSLDGRLLACPYYKYDPIRYSEYNIEEKAYRGCSSSYLSTISRLKQHLYRVHRRPEFYCRSCFQVFQSENQLDIHTRTRPSCEPCESKFGEKMTVEQMASVKRRKSARTPSETWFAIFQILFPEASLPESPYADSVSTNAIRAFTDHFQRCAQAILSRLIREQLGSTLVLHSDQQRILDSALESAIAQLVMQVGPANRRVEDQQAALEPPEIGIQRPLNWDMGNILLENEVEECRIPAESEPFMASSDHEDPHNPVAWTPSWGFDGLDDLGDIETVFH